MRFVDKLGAVFGINHAAAFSIGQDDIDPSLFGLSSYSNFISQPGKVSRQTAQACGPVSRAYDLIPGALGMLPIDLIGPDFVKARSELFVQPEIDKPRSVTLTETYADLYYEGIAWWYITDFNVFGYPSKVRRLEPGSVNVMQNQQVFITPDRHTGIAQGYAPDARLIRFDSPRPGLLVAAARAIRTFALLSQAGANAAEGVPPVDYFTPAEGVDPADDTAIQAILDEWQAARQKRRTGYVPAALSYNTAGWNPEQLLLVEQIEKAALEIANHGGVDPEEVGVSVTSRTYFNAQDRQQARSRGTLGMLRRAVEDRLSMPDVTPGGYASQLDLTEWLRTDDQTRMTVATQGLSGGVFDEDEARAYFDPTLPRRAATAAPKLAPTTEELLVQASNEAAKVVRLNFGDGSPEALNFSVPMTAAPAVDHESRTISGLMVPYGVKGTSYGRTWVFGHNTLTWDDPSRVKLWIRHDPNQVVGFGLAFDSRPTPGPYGPAGLYGTFKVAKTPEGDQALLDADPKGDNRTLDAFSIGIPPNAFTDLGGKYSTDADGTLRAVSVPLMETSLTPAPIFTGARVHAVAASATTNQGEIQMKLTAEQRARLKELREMQTRSAEQETELSTLMTAAAEEAIAGGGGAAAPPAADGDGAPAGDGDFSAALQGAVTAGFSAAIAQIGPRSVVPAGGVQVNEPLPYRFDGTSGEHDFSTDLFAAARFGSGEAQERLGKFMEDAAKAPQFAVATGDVDELNPPKTRADLYVDYIPKVAPVYSAIYTGSLDDSTPFYVPAYNADANLANDHTEGNEPGSEGSFSTTKRTITPAALDAYVGVNREVVDAGGNPQVSGLIWNQMQRRYAEQLEVKSAGILTGSAAAELGAAIAAGSIPEVVADAVEDGLINLQFVQGGGLFDTFLGHQELYKALANARSTTTVLDSDDTQVQVVTGQKRYAQISPQNANGSAQTKWKAIDVGGFLLAPAPSLGADGVGQKSYNFAKEAVGFWNSAPKRIDWIAGTAKINFGYLGYWGGAILNPNLIRKVTYDRTA